MENQAIIPERLGGITFFIFFLKRCPFLIIIILFLAAAIFGKTYIPLEYAQYGDLAVSVLTAIFFIFIFIILFIAWLEFIRYKIYITPESIKINRGILSEEQIGIPFRHIQDATIKRGIFYQLIGVSALVLNVSGDEGAQAVSRETKIILPALNKKLALKIQDEILKKAEVEEMSMRADTPPAA
jgi:uncharacterized membrane protein YdbT with pleckstrin-like domain